MKYLGTETLPLAGLARYPGNPRRGVVEAIRESVREFGGQYRGIVVRVEAGVPTMILAGNHTADALEAEDYAGARADLVECTDTEARKINLADNRLAELGTYDDGELIASLVALDGDLSATGWGEQDLARLLVGQGGGQVRDPDRPSLADRFLIPPFDVLDARQGWWQDRKRAWLALGITSELGRGGRLTGRLWDASERQTGYSRAEETGLLFRSASGRDPHYYEKKTAAEAAAGRTLTQAEFEQTYYVPTAYDPGHVSMTGTSVFDPVLCELAVRWFSPPGGLVLDPFAGGSVRGVVAGILGRGYSGCDLSPAQVEADRAQAAEILGRAPAGQVAVKVSAAMARQRFHGCEPGYIRDVCHGACCRSSTQRGGILVTIHPSERAAVEAAGGVVTDGLLEPVDRRCPFQERESELCGLHGTGSKPFGCIASPFTLNRAGTLIVRNRYRSLVCYRDDRDLDGPAPPAYKAFRASLDLIFGEDGAAKLDAHLDGGGGDIVLPVGRDVYAMLRDNDAVKHGGAVAAGEGAVAYHAGDAADWVTTLAPDSADLLFTCPPYLWLERYTDDPADLSNMKAAAFEETYAHILAGAAKALRPDRFAVIVTGDVREENAAGRLVDLRGLTVRAAADAGLTYQTGAVLVTQVSSLAIRAAGPFEKGRLLGRTHQDVLVFVKGDRRKAAAACGPVEVHLPDALTEPWDGT